MMVLPSRKNTNSIYVKQKKKLELGDGYFMMFVLNLYLIWPFDDDILVVSEQNI